MVAAYSYLLASPCGVENEKIVWYRGGFTNKRNYSSSKYYMKENHGLAHSCYSWGNLSHHLALLLLDIKKYSQFWKYLKIW